MLWSSASPSPVPAAISAMFPPRSASPSCSTCSSGGCSTGIEYAIAWRSLSSVTLGTPNAVATCRASTRQGTLVSSAASPITGPATPKHAFEIDARRVSSLSMNLAIIDGRSGKSSVPNVRTATGLGRAGTESNNPSCVLVPPISPARIMINFQRSSFNAQGL